MSRDLANRRLPRLAGAVVATAGAVSWAALLARLQLRSLHLLQLEGYQTGRFLRWSVQRRERWVSNAALAGGFGSGALAGLTIAGRGHVLGAWPIVAAWGALGGWSWWTARSAPSTKPLVLTSRAKRLLAGQSLLTLLLAAGPAAVIAGRSASRQHAMPCLMIGAAVASLLMPLITAGANLLLWPVEEAFRRYYLADARRKLRAVGPTVVGVAGSYGKTSTKELTATILGARWNVLKPPGSYNTPMGISRVIREQLTPAHELFVAELGDYVPGDVRFLCDLVRPTIGILTTIGPEHLERFKTLERIVHTKEELIDALPPDGVAVVNQDDPLVRAIGDRAAARGLKVLRYGQTERGADVRALDVQTTRDGLSFTVAADGHGEARFQIDLLGRHNVMNVLAATSTALTLGMSLPEIAAAARQIRPVEHRLEPIHGVGGVLVIDDTYNSNPRGAAEALTVLGDLPGGRKILVTPGMIELAERQFEEHFRLGKRAAAVCDEVILVGPERTRPIADGLHEAGFPSDRVHLAMGRDAATAQLGKLLRAGDVVLWENDLPDTYAEETGDRRQETGAARHAIPQSPLPLRDGGPSHTANQSIQEMGTASPELPPLPRAGPWRGGEAERLHGRKERGRGWGETPINGLRIVHREQGPTDAPPVVVLHGWGANIAAVASIQSFVSRSHRTVAIDLPGFGASDPPPVPWSSREYVELLRAFLAQSGVGRASFIGHSFGGKLSIVLAAMCPEMVEKLVLVDSAGIRPKRGASYYAQVYAYKACRRLLATTPLNGTIAASLQRLFDSRFGSDDYRQADSMRGTLVRVVNEDVRHLLPRIAAPTLLIWGERDDSTPVSDGRLMEQLIPDAGLVVFSGAGHFAYADDFDRFARVVGHFLATRQESG